MIPGTFGLVERMAVSVLCQKDPFTLYYTMYCKTCKEKRPSLATHARLPHAGHMIDDLTAVVPSLRKERLTKRQGASHTK